ncbi:hypothetical protein FB446DRAFT_41835 [Lentinula raphanica]|nr:hypothetical protein FB446DRAFT_41835 [Lentinula raphanica]
MAPSRYQVAKQGWGSQPNFQHSHGLKMTPDDIEEGNHILDEYARHDNDDYSESPVDDNSHSEHDSSYTSDDSQEVERQGHGYTSDEATEHLSNLRLEDDYDSDQNDSQQEVEECSDEGSATGYASPYEYHEDVSYSSSGYYSSGESAAGTYDDSGEDGDYGSNEDYDDDDDYGDDDGYDDYDDDDD